VWECWSYDNKDIEGETGKDDVAGIQRDYFWHSTEKRSLCGSYSGSIRKFLIGNIHLFLPSLWVPLF
jgi:hypothetical protein